MSFDYQAFNLPVAQIVPALLDTFKTDNTLLLSAETGAGKSTLFPLVLMESWLPKGKKIIVLEPRRIAARSIAHRMADMLGEAVGKRIGYRIRFETRVSDATVVEVVTEGILTRMLQSDNALEGVAMVVFDEFHERSIHADLALALCRESQQILRPDLRVLVMSATLDLLQLSELLQCKVLKCSGRTYPVAIKYTGAQDLHLLPENTVFTVMKAAQESTGDILVFLPGEGEIRKVEALLRPKMRNIAIHPLYGMLPHNKQYQALMPDRNGKRKIVLATSIAETSLTIEGVGIVVDCGYSRTSKFDPKAGLSRLETIAITKDAADQRAGRAGRLGPGVCYRMWPEALHERLIDHRIPEILEADLTSLVLEMAVWGVKDINGLTWLSPPKPYAVAQATQLLQELGALEDGVITEHGRAMHGLPCHPRLAHMLIKAQEEYLLPLGCDLAAIIEEKDPLPRDSGININLRIEALRRFREGKNDIKAFSRIEKVAESYRQMFDISPENSVFDEHETGLLLAFAYPERIAGNRPGNNAQFQLANGKLAMAGHRDDLANETWLAIANMDAGQDMGRIFLASPINPQDLKPFVKTVENIGWDLRKGGVVASVDLRIGSIVLQSKPLQVTDKQKIVTSICDCIKKEGAHLLNFDEAVTQWQNRVLSLAKWNPNENWPDVSTETLIATVHQWLSPYLNEIKYTEDLKKLDIKTILQNALDYSQQQALDKLAPTKIEVKSGSKVALEYQANGSAPLLAVRLQELFGELETPSVNQGKAKVLLHLLSPAYKPVQVTGDLKSFWANAYFEVKKELKQRYPKHFWPENPLEAPAIKGTKKQNGLK